MKYIAKLHNYPLKWEIDAESDAEEKAWEAICADMDEASVSAGGFLELHETKSTRTAIPGMMVAEQKGTLQ